MVIINIHGVYDNASLQERGHKQDKHHYQRHGHHKLLNIHGKEDNVLLLYRGHNLERNTSRFRREK